MSEILFAVYLFFAACTLLFGAYEFYRQYKRGSLVVEFLILTVSHVFISVVPIANAFYVIVRAGDSKFIQNILDKKIGGHKNES